MKLHARPWGALALALAALACARQEPPPAPDVVARLGDEVRRYADFDAFLAHNLGESAGALASEALSQLFDQFIRESLLERLAADRGLAAAGAGAARASEALLAAAALPEPTAEEIGATYEREQAAFVRPERVLLRQLLTEDRAVAERARRELVAGADFATVARRAELEPTTSTVDAPVELARDELPPAFAEGIFDLGDGEVSAVVSADYGFHVFQVVRHLPAETAPLAEVEPEIRRRLAGERADAALADLLAEAVRRFPVVVYDRNLPFAYRGGFTVSRPYDESNG